MKIISKKITAMILITLLAINTASFAVVAPNATIHISGDDAYRLYIDGSLIGEDWQNPSDPDSHNWSDVETYNVTLTDDYVIAIEAADLFGSIAGLSVKVIVTDGPSFDIMNSVWKVSTSVNSAWKTEKLYAAGDNWTDVSSVTPHQSWPSAGAWGWTQNSLASTMDKTAFFKYYIPKPIVEGTVTVYHYLVDTTTPLGTVAPITGLYENPYQTSALELSGYTVTIPENASGLFTADPIDVIYFYTPVQVTTEPETTQPETTQPETTQPETTQPETTQPETTQPETTQPETTQPETTQPETTQPETTQPETTQPETTQPVTTQPETTQPQTTQPETTQPATTQPTTEDDDEEPTEPQTIPTTEASTETLVAEELPLGEASIFDFNSFQSSLTTETTEAVEEIVIDDEETPLADALPQTGQLPAELFYGIGGLISAAGFFLKRKR